MNVRKIFDFIGVFSAYFIFATVAVSFIVTVSVLADWLQDKEDVRSLSGFLAYMNDFMLSVLIIVVLVIYYTINNILIRWGQLIFCDNIRKVTPTSKTSQKSREKKHQ